MSTPQASSRSQNILLVEDHPDTARVMSRLLRSVGHTVRMWLIPSHQPLPLPLRIISTSSSATLDFPDGTGIDLIIEIRKNKLPSLPMAALTGFGMEKKDVAKCLKAGFNDHLTKPVELQKLEALIGQLGSRNNP